MFIPGNVGDVELILASQQLEAFEDRVCVKAEPGASQ